MRPVAVLGLFVALGSSSVLRAQDVAQGVAHPKPTPAGTWHTIDDVSGKPRGIVVIREVGGRFVGVLTGSFDPADSLSPICDRCSGDRKGKPVFGMEILRGLRPDGDSWSGGEILDPDTGKVYKAKAHLEDDGRKLVVRGYIGFSLLGRSQVWLRAKEGQ